MVTASRAPWLHRVSRVVPTVKDIGLWGPRVQKAFADMGVMDYARIDVAQVLANDGRVAEDFDRKMFVERSIAAEQVS